LDFFYVLHNNTCSQVSFISVDNYCYAVIYKKAQLTQRERATAVHV